jgi:HD-GYP domain-containing protein (c-di-GMP phosphodiesterase class II)
MSAHNQYLDAATERRIEASQERRLRALDPRERQGLFVLTGAFLAAATALAVLATPARELSPLLALAFVVAYIAAARIEFSTGAGYTVPTQLVFVPMLLLLPTPLVPVAVLVALFTSSAVDVVRGHEAPGRALNSFADAMYAFGPAVVIVAFDAQIPAWEHAPVYVLALASQFAVELAVYVARLALCYGVPGRESVGELRLGHRVDTLLSPIGLLAAVAASDTPAAALLVLALVPLLRGFEKERQGRIQRSLELGRAYRGTALLLRDLLEEDDEYTGHHTEDVVDLSVKVAVEMGVSEDVQRETEMGALLHDIGKIAVPDEIINKPGPLNDEEWAIMRTHTVEGERMLQQVGGLLSSVGLVVRASHERWDGGGYPDGLAGEQIPVAARIVSACDAFNAMTTDRSYRKALPLEVALGELRANAGTQFAPEVVEALLAVIERETPDWQLAIAEPAAAPVAAPRAA